MLKQFHSGNFHPINESNFKGDQEPVAETGNDYIDILLIKSIKDHSGFIDQEVVLTLADMK